MAKSQNSSISASLWSALGALFVTILMTLWNVVGDADPDFILYRACIVLTIIFVTLLGAQTFARVSVQSMLRSQQSTKARQSD